MTSAAYMSIIGLDGESDGMSKRQNETGTRVIQKVSKSIVLFRYYKDRSCTVRDVSGS